MLDVGARETEVQQADARGTAESRGQGLGEGSARKQASLAGLRHYRLQGASEWGISQDRMARGGREVRLETPYRRTCAVSRRLSFP